jgi:alpha-mannosidase
MKEFDDFVFCCAGAQCYKWVEENAPGMFEEVRARVKEGRWSIVGGWWIQPDCNMPDGETFVRHSLYGQRYFKEKFGVTAKTGYNVDSFGHNQMLPQILRKSGMENYVFMRPGPHENQLPASLFWWEAPDKSRVLAYRIPVSYTFRGESTGEMREALDRSIKEITDLQDIDVMFFYGVGNHGGGPTVKNLEMIHELQSERGEEMIIDAPDAYFDDIRKMNLELPVVTAGLLHHAAGCYATMSEVKRLHRLAEQRMNACEKLCVLSSVLTNTEYPLERLGAAWENILFNTFHDVLCGCSIKEAYNDVFAFYGETLSVSSKLLNTAAGRISWNIDTMPGIPFYLSKEKHLHLYEKEQLGVPVVVFNANAFEETRLVRIREKQMTCVEDDTRTAVSHQIVTGNREDGSRNAITEDTVFETRVPALGYRVYWIYLDKPPAVPDKIAESDLHISKNVMENSLYRLTFDEQNASVEIYDKKNRIILAAAASLPIVIEDNPFDTWAHGCNIFDTECGRFSGAEFEILDDGPVMIRMRFSSRYEQSEIVQIFTMLSDNPQIQVEVSVNWQQPHKRLKLAFPLTSAENCECVYDIPYGFARGKLDKEETPCQKWIDITGQIGNQTFGITIINSCKYSFSAGSENELRLTAVRSPLYADHSGYRDSRLTNMDIGVAEFSYAILPHTGPLDPYSAVKAAKTFCAEPSVVIETYHSGELPLLYNGISVSGTVVAEVIKRAQEDNGTILRLFEAAGKPSESTIDFPLLGIHFTANFSGHEIKTFFIGDNKRVKEVNLLEF